MEKPHRRRKSGGLIPSSVVLQHVTKQFALLSVVGHGVKKRIEIRELKVVGRQHFVLLGRAICNQCPLLTTGFWLGAGGWSFLPPDGGRCSSEACPLDFCPSKEVKTSGLKKNVLLTWLFSTKTCWASSTPNTLLVLPALTMVSSSWDGPASFSWPQGNQCFFPLCLDSQTETVHTCAIPSSGWQVPRLPRNRTTCPLAWYLLLGHEGLCTDCLKKHKVSPGLFIHECWEQEQTNLWNNSMK